MWQSPTAKEREYGILRIIYLKRKYAFTTLSPYLISESIPRLVHVGIQPLYQVGEEADLSLLYIRVLDYGLTRASTYSPRHRTWELASLAEGFIHGSLPL